MGFYPHPPSLQTRGSSKALHVFSEQSPSPRFCRRYKFLRILPIRAFHIPYWASWYVIPYPGFLKLKCPVWVPVRAQQNGCGIVRAAAATYHSLDPGLCACTRVLCTPLFPRSSHFGLPLLCSFFFLFSFSRRPDDPIPILLSANMNPYRAFQFQESLVWDHIPRCPVWDSERVSRLGVWFTNPVKATQCGKWPAATGYVENNLDKETTPTRAPFWVVGTKKLCDYILFGLPNPILSIREIVWGGYSE